MGDVRLRGHRILVVEDHYLVAADTARLVSGAGGEALGPFRSEAAALASAESNLATAAILDINLGTEDSLGLATTLLERGIPVVFLTGYTAVPLPERLARIPCLIKPVASEALIEALLSAIGRGP